MSLRYDFDMFSVVPKELQEQVRSMGLPAGAVKEQIALWRDPAIVNALRGASPCVQEFFRDSGFGLNVYDSGAPAGFYPAYDEVGRIRVIEKLTRNMQRLDLASAEFNGFDFGAFLEYVADAEPWDEPGQGVPEAPEKRRTGAATFGPAEELGRDMFAHVEELKAKSEPEETPEAKRSISPVLAVAAACALYLAVWQGSSLFGLDSAIVSMNSADFGALTSVTSK